jgi:ABC-type Fe3+/spermidine/putrescine transport system ATPase subunit
MPLARTLKIPIENDATASDDTIDPVMMEAIQKHLKEKKITTIFATHDSSDVLSFADEVLVLKDGQLIEEGNPKSIYNHPKNKYIASLFGDVNEIELDGKIEGKLDGELDGLMEGIIVGDTEGCKDEGNIDGQ